MHKFIILLVAVTFVRCLITQDSSFIAEGIYPSYYDARQQCRMVTDEYGDNVKLDKKFFVVERKFNAN
jgi:hypothetical protein